MVWPGRYLANGVIHIVITPSPYSVYATTECGINYVWRDAYAEGTPTCLHCWYCALRRP